MNRLVRVAAGTLGLVLSLIPLNAEADWVRDQLYVTLREGPGLDHTRLETLASGDQVRTLTRRAEWAKVKTSEGVVGWIPSKYLQKTPPAAQTLQQEKLKLGKAEERVAGLEARLKTQTGKLAELETLREELAKIQKENAAMTSSSRWRMLVAGGAIVLLGIAIGAFAPRSRPDKTRRLRF